MTQKRRHSDQPGDEPVKFIDCRNMRKECRSNWRWIIGLLVAFFVSISGVIYASTASNTDDISGLAERVSSQEAVLKRVEKNTDEMRQDIKKLLQQER